MPEIRTVAEPHTVEIEKVRGSRFIGDVAPVGKESAAAAFIDSIRSRELSATHHCWALRLAGGHSRSSDDGEPRDTAGPPILRRIEAAGLADVAVVVTRYYGGTNLGRGGLIRAYGSAAASVLDAAPTVARRTTETVTVEHPYDLSAQVETVLARFEAGVVSADYAEAVRVQVAVPVDSVTRFSDAMAEATAGRVEVVVGPGTS